MNEFPSPSRGGSGRGACRKKYVEKMGRDMRLSEHSNTKRDYNRARSLRNDPSPFEQKLWLCLREEAKRRNLKFRRQQPIHPFIADFACMEARLIVELDGASHDTRLGYDKSRDEKLKQMGYIALRFTNQDVAKNLEYVVNTILDHAARLVLTGKKNTKRRAPLPNPPRKREGSLLLCITTEDE
jgi:very-short-patch-repair endonuclease